MADEQIKNPEEMSLEELKAAVLADEAKEPEAPPAPVADVVVPAEEVAEEVPEQVIYKKEIDLGDGSGVQVFTGKGATALEALEELTEKLADAQRHATKKIHELNTRVKAEDTRSAQQKADDDYVIKQRLDKEPGKTIDERVDQRLAEREAREQRDRAAQRRFVDSHPEFIADEENGLRMYREAKNLGIHSGEWNDENLEKAFQSLRAVGLIKLKVEEAGGTTEEKAEEPQRIVEPKVEATQPRSPKKASTVSMRGGAAAPSVKTAPTEDELYAMPLDKLRQLSKEQLAKAAGE